MLKGTCQQVHVALTAVSIKQRLHKNHVLLQLSWINSTLSHPVDTALCQTIIPLLDIACRHRKLPGFSDIPGSQLCLKGTDTASDPVSRPWQLPRNFADCHSTVGMGGEDAGKLKAGFTWHFFMHTFMQKKFILCIKNTDFYGKNTPF